MTLWRYKNYFWPRINILSIYGNTNQLMVDETNKYAMQCGFSAKRRKYGDCWEPVTISEIKDFIAIWKIKYLA